MFFQFARFFHLAKKSPSGKNLPSGKSCQLNQKDFHKFQPSCDPNPNLTVTLTLKVFVTLTLTVILSLNLTSKKFCSIFFRNLRTKQKILYTNLGKSFQFSLQDFPLGRFFPLGDFLPSGKILRTGKTCHVSFVTFSIDVNENNHFRQKYSKQMKIEIF